MKKRKIFSGIVVAIILVAAYGFYQYNRRIPAVTQMEPDIKITADSLLTAFSDDEKKAAEKFGEPQLILQVSGRLKALETTSGGAEIFVLGDSNASSSVRCMIDTSFQLDKKAWLPGGYYKVKGYFNGYKPDITGLLGADIEMSRCIPLKNK